MSANSRPVMQAKPVTFLLTVVCLSLLSFILSACTASGEDETQSLANSETGVSVELETLAGDGELTVGFIPGLSSTTFDQVRDQSIREALQDELEATVVQPTDTSTVALQVEAMYQMVAEGIGYIVFVPNANDMWSEAIQTAKDADVVVVAVGGVLESAVSQLVDNSYSPSGNDEGTVAAEWINENIPGEQVVELAASNNQTQYLRQRTLTLYLGEQLVGTIENVNDISDLEQLLPHLLETYPEATVLIVQRESLLSALVEAIENSPEAQARNFKIVSFGGSTSSFELLQEGKIDYLVYQDPYLGSRVVEMLRKQMSGSNMYSGNTPLVRGFDQTVSEQMVEKYGY